MSNEKTKLADFNNSEYKIGRSFIVYFLWYFVNVFFINSYLFPIYGLKTFLLRLFGAEIGKGVLIKPKVNIKYPWKLKIGNHVWIGENVWIDNLDFVSIGDNTCISQGALILNGNHNYKKQTFDLITRPITLEDGVWIGAKSVVTQGVVCKSHSFLTAGSTAITSLEPYSIYQGNPAKKIRDREIE